MNVIDVTNYYVPQGVVLIELASFDVFKNIFQDSMGYASSCYKLVGKNHYFFFHREICFVYNG